MKRRPCCAPARLLRAGSLPLVLTLALAAAPAARAAVFTPTKTADTADGACDRDCSLREAITAANENNGADVLLLPAGIYVLSLSGGGEDANATGDLDVRGELTVVGDGAGSTVIDAAGLDRVIHVTGLAGAVELQNLTLRNGNTTGSGGGVFTDAAELTLTRVVVAGNSANGFGGGIYSSDALTVTDSTIAGNQSVRAGGGLIAAGAAELANVTISGNRSTTEFGGGIYLFGGTAARINNVTVTGNTAALRGGGAFVESSAFIGQNPPLFSNSVLAGNTAPEHPDCSGAAISAGWNLIGVGDGCADFRPAQHDLEGTTAAPLDAKLGALGGNGGPTPTRPLLVGSPARDAGNPAAPNGQGAACQAEDQRGLDRPGTGGPARCDIGAFEVTAACVPGSTALCLNDGRFRVTATFRTPQGQTGEAQAVQLTPDAGYLWFFDPANIEITIKVLNACVINDRYWVFASGLTNVRVDLTVTDTATGQVKTYLNPQGTTFQPRLDTNAFATCTYSEP